MSARRRWVSWADITWAATDLFTDIVTGLLVFVARPIAWAIFNDWDATIRRLHARRH